MKTTLLPDYGLTSDMSFTVHLIERGLNYIQQGRHAEGVAVFELAREQFAPNQGSLATSLDAFIEGYVEYRRAQQAHQEASIRFAKAYAEQQARVATLGALLPALLEETHTQQCSPPPRSCADTTNAQSSPSPDFRPTPVQFPRSSSPIDPLFTEDTSSNTLPALYVTCFGRFEVRRSDHPDQQMTLCTNRSGQTILRYLITQPGHRATVDKLMDICWPGDERSVALHKLRVAMSALRCSLNRDHSIRYGSGYILCKAEFYQLNPAVTVKTDMDEFLTLYHAGRKIKGHGTIEQYEAACNLYTGPFLVEDLYADWSLIQRTQLSNIHLIMCSVLSDHYLKIDCYEDAVKWATKVLKENCCDENAHRQIMHAYAVQGRRDEALRQHQLCEHVLREELSMSPTPETVNLLHKIVNGELSLPAR
jgi:DNA-binding SARP family transcriptional activator